MGEMMRKTTFFKSCILSKEILVMPAAHDALTAKIIEKTGFKAVAVGGYGASAALLGKADVSLLTLTEMVDYISRIADNLKIPLCADGDTGHGNVTNVIRTIRAMEKAGAAGLSIEDQVFPKRCGHMEGKQVIPQEEMAAKIMAAVDARVDPDFVILARTDSLSVYGLEEAIERGNTYREAGADLIFVEAYRSMEEMRSITHAIKAPTMATNMEGGKSPLISAKELETIGFSVVVFPASATYAITKATGDLMAEIYRNGTSKGFLDRMVTFDEFNKIVDLSLIRDTEKKYVSCPKSDLGI